MRNFSNPIFNGTLEQSIAGLPKTPYIERVGFEIENAGFSNENCKGDGRKAVLAMSFDNLGFYPNPGDFIKCSSLGIESVWKVIRVASGYPGKISIKNLTNHN